MTQFTYIIATSKRACFSIFFSMWDYCFPDFIFSIMLFVLSLLICRMLHTHTHHILAAAAKSLQSCLTLLRPHRQQPTRLRRPCDSPGKNIGMSCHFLLQCMKLKSESEVTQSCPTLHDPRAVAYQAPPSMRFARQESWSGVPLPSLSYS